MPIFDYKCPDCHSERKDVLVPRYDARVRCSVCYAVMVRQAPVSNSHFKGAGFHATDYDKKKGRKSK